MQGSACRVAMRLMSNNRTEPLRRRPRPPMHRFRLWFHNLSARLKTPGIRQQQLSLTTLHFREKCQLRSIPHQIKGGNPRWDCTFPKTYRSALPPVSLNGFASLKRPLFSYKALIGLILWDSKDDLNVLLLSRLYHLALVCYVLAEATDSPFSILTMSIIITWFPSKRGRIKYMEVAFEEFEYAPGN